MKAQQLRDEYIRFFKERGHKQVPSAPLVPVGDPTLLFTTAGMVQFKPLWVGAVKLPYTRAISVQKCLRLSDLENVGFTPRHDTLFEMLGNFSFGDYFKEEATAWSWEFLTKIVKLPVDKLWVSIYLDDDDAFEIWTKKVGVAADRIVRMGDEDNFWGPAGSSGSCGPCSEIHYDFGKEHGCGKDCDPSCGCSRWLEIWNLVFPQYDQQEDGTRMPLKNRGIDTGMGLERLAMVVQGKENIFETDLFFPIIQAIAAKVNVPYNKSDQTDIAMKIIADHVRALTFTIAENITPSNEGRGYVLRRLLRRASKYGRDLGLEKPFLFELVDEVVAIMHKTYPELVEKQDAVKTVIEREEIRFLKTLDQGLGLLSDFMDKAKKKGQKEISGKDAFILYDTYGFPVEMTAEILAENNMLFDRDQYDEALEKAREIARQSWQGGSAVAEDLKLLKSIVEKTGETQFVGYEKMTEDSKVLAIICDGVEVDSASVIDATYALVLDKTPFYAESGGQVSDLGTISGDGFSFQVSHVSKTPDNLFVHSGKLLEGEISGGVCAKAAIDQDYRHEIMKHHTATHLLQAALQKVVGKHVGQAGSYVCEQYLRFDFSHFQGLTAKEIDQVNLLVNEYIQTNTSVFKKEMSMDEARELGALAFFGDKYGEMVRIAKIGDISCELCGGTHVDAIGEIGFFRIVAESSVSSGTRRIEAVVGKTAVQKAFDEEKTLQKMAKKIKVPVSDILEAVEKLQTQNKELEKKLADMASKNIVGSADELLENAETIGEVRLIAKAWKDVSSKDLLPLVDALKEKGKEKLVVMFVSSIGGKVQLLVGVTKDLVKTHHSGKIVKELAALVGGGGGGRPDIAQAGGKNPENIDQVMKKIVELV